MTNGSRRSSPRGALSDLSCDANEVRGTSGSFPLTPALSLGERESTRAHSENSTAPDSLADWRRFPLSLRERAGVRGKKLRDD